MAIIWKSDLSICNLSLRPVLTQINDATRIQKKKKQNELSERRELLSNGEYKLEVFQKKRKKKHFQECMLGEKRRRKKSVAE